MITSDNVISDTIVVEYFNSHPNDCLLDIETTGFNKITDTIIILGLLYKNNNEIHLLQWACESLSDEKLVITSFLEFLKEKKHFITYNGEQFDWKFIEKKCELYNLIMDSFTHFDLYIRLKPHFSILPFDNLKLNTLITYFDSEAIVKGSGADCVHWYHMYLKKNDISFLDSIMEHNYSDLIGLCIAQKALSLLDSLLTIEIQDSIIRLVNYQIDKNMIRLSAQIESIGPNLHSAEIYLPYSSLILNLKNSLLSVDLEFRILKLDDSTKLLISDTNALKIAPLKSSVFGLPPNVIPLAMQVDKKSKLLIDSIKWVIKALYKQAL